MEGVGAAPAAAPRQARGAAGPGAGAGAPAVKLWGSKHEREHVESAADLFALIKAAEKLEKMYVRDLVAAKEYEPACLKLIAQFKTLRTSLGYNTHDVERFMSKYGMECLAAKNRLLRSGMPATLEHGDASATSENSNNAAVVAQSVQYFITAMDSLKINMTAVDQLHPLLNDLLMSLCKVQQLPPDFTGKTKIREWNKTLEAMRAHEELGEEQTRQLLFDLETSYNAFMASLPTP